MGLVAEMRATKMSDFTYGICMAERRAPGRIGAPELPPPPRTRLRVLSSRTTTSANSGRTCFCGVRVQGRGQPSGPPNLTICFGAERKKLRRAVSALAQKQEKNIFFKFRRGVNREKKNSLISAAKARLYFCRGQ